MTDSISYSQFRKDPRASWTITKPKSSISTVQIWFVVGRSAHAELQKIGRGIGKLAYWLLSKERGIAGSNWSVSFQRSLNPLVPNGYMNVSSTLGCC